MGPHSLTSLLAKEVLLYHGPADGVVKVLVLLKCFKGDGVVDLLQIAVPGVIQVSF